MPLPSKSSSIQSDVWKLTINTKKYLIIHLGNKKSLCSYHIYDFFLSNPLVAKYLSVTIDNRLSFSPHIATIVSKAK